MNALQCGGVDAAARSVRIAARSLSRAGLVHAYGHVSVRLDADTFLVCPPVPMGLVPAGDPCTRVPVRGPLPAGVLGEVRLHQSVYARRADVGAVCRIQSPQVMALSALRRVPRARHGFGCYLAPRVALWDDVQLLRDTAAADALADELGDGAAIVMRGNGAVVVGSSIERAVVLSWYLEDAARVELEVHRAGAADNAPVIPDDEAARRAVWSGGIAERMWAHLTAADPESAP